MEANGRRRGGSNGYGRSGGNGRRASGGPSTYRRVQVTEAGTTSKQEGETDTTTQRVVKAVAIDLDEPTRKQASPAPSPPRPFKSSLLASLANEGKDARKGDRTDGAPATGQKNGRANGNNRNENAGNSGTNGNGRASIEDRKGNATNANAGNGNRSNGSTAARRPQSATTTRSRQPSNATNNRGRSISSQDLRAGERDGGLRSLSSTSDRWKSPSSRALIEDTGQRDAGRNGRQRGRSPVKGSPERGSPGKPPRRQESVDSVSSRTSQASHRSTRSTRSTRSSRNRRRDSMDSVSSQRSIRSEVDRSDRYQRWGERSSGRGQGLRDDAGWRGPDREPTRRVEYSKSDSTASQPRSVPFQSSLAASLAERDDETRSNGRRSRGASPAPIPPSLRGWRSSLSTSLSRESSEDRHSISGRIDHQHSQRAVTPGVNCANDDTRHQGTGRFSFRRSESLNARADYKPQPGTLASRLWSSRERSESRDSISSTGDKDARVREYYARMDNEDKKRETARRSIPMKSSLRSSLATSPMKSSLMASIDATTQSSSSSLSAPCQKTTYNLEMLRSLKDQGVPPVFNISSVSIVEVITVRQPTAHHNPSSASSARMLKRSESRGTRGGHRGGGRAGKMDRRPGGSGGRRRERDQPPPPPLFDGPVEPIKHSENRWVKPTAKSPLETVLSQVKSLLNKLTREKFAKLTEELCAIEMKSLEMLRSMITVVMDKAVEEPNFSDVYADLCKELHARSASTIWSFLRAAESVTTPKVYYWTAVRHDDCSGFVGPFESAQDCLNASQDPPKEDAELRSCDISAAKIWIAGDHLIAVYEDPQGAFFYRKREIASLSEDEPVIGKFSSVQDALHAAAKQTTFKRLLVTRCQFEFERWHGSKPVDQANSPAESEEVDERQRQIDAIRKKRSMLGHIRFLGELFKADILNAVVVQNCMFSLLGLELIVPGDNHDAAAKILRCPEEDDIEALCKLLSTVGKKYDKPATQHIMKIVILRLVELSEDTKMPSRARFLMKDILEMRDYLWEPRRKELEQKTLEEVRREALQLQQQGKNAQHDNLSKRRHKSRISSLQLARQSSNLLIQEDEVEEEEVSPSKEPQQVLTESTNSTDDKKLASRARSIVEEYISIHDIEEAAQCIGELPGSAIAAFVEHAVNSSLDGKENERSDAVDLLVKLYERGSIDATIIQAALQAAMEFFDDMQIDIPLLHQYSAYLFGRLIACGCFGLSWMISKAIKHLVASGMASQIFAEALGTIADENDDATVSQMLTDEEIDPARVLPASSRDTDAVRKFIVQFELEAYFDGSDDDDDDDSYEMEIPHEAETKMRSTLEEYLNILDVDEVILCLNEMENACGTLRWAFFVRVSVLLGIDADTSIRAVIAKLLATLLERDQISVEDLERAFASILLEFDDLVVDIPKLAHNLSETWSPLLFMPNGLTVAWLYDITQDLISAKYASEVLSSTLSELETLYGAETLLEWWRKQQGSETWWTPGRGQDNTLDANLARWQQKLCV